MSGADKIAQKIKSGVEEAKKPSKAARKRAPSAFPFKVQDGRLCRQTEEEGVDGKLRKKWVPFASELNVLALTRTSEGEDWGRLLQVVDRDGEEHLWAMPLSLLAGDGRDLRAKLLDLGLEPVAGAGRKWKEWLTEYLFGAEPDTRARCVSQTGWHGNVFVLPDATIGSGDVADRILLQSAHRIDHAYEVAGTLEGWRDGVARPAEKNSRLTLAISAAFAAALLEFTDDDGGGFHLRGGSSVGKSTALIAAGSVWGGGGLRGYMKTWRATDNALESLAEIHNNSLLCLDELAQVEPRAAGAAAYMLANGQGKARAGREGHARRAASWRLLFLSTGEIALADKIAEGGGRVAAGMQVRVIDIRADAGAGLGLFEDLHEADDAASFAQGIKRAAGEHYGTPARAFLEALAGDLMAVRENLSILRKQFAAAAVSAGADGQVRRVADRFALVAAGGELATSLGVTGWKQGAAIEAALRCFRDWVSERGGVGAGETAEAKRRIARAIEIDGAARFQKFHLNADRAVITNRLGFVKVEGDGGNHLEQYEWYFMSNGLREVLDGLDFRSVTDALVADGVIVAHAPKQEKSRIIHVPNAGKKFRLYQISAELMGGEVEADGGVADG